MTKVHFTSALKRFFPNLETITVEGSNVSEVLIEVEKKYPGIQSYLLNDTGEIRSHVNIFIGEEMATLDHKLGDKDEIFVFQALSGG